MEDKNQTNDRQLNRTSANNGVMVDSLADLIEAQDLMRLEAEIAEQRKKAEAEARKEAAKKEAIEKAEAAALAAAQARAQSVSDNMAKNNSDHSAVSDGEETSKEAIKTKTGGSKSPKETDPTVKGKVSQKSKTSLFIIIGILIAAVLVGGWFVMNQKSTVSEQEITETESEPFRLTYAIGGEKEVLTQETYGKWIKKDSTGNDTVDDAQLVAYLSALNDRYTTIGKDHLFVNHKGESIVVSGGTYGWAIDLEKEAAQLKADLLAKQSLSREPISTGVVYKETGDDIGDTYIEVSIENQTMWLYQSAQCVLETPIVTGNQEHAAQKTPTGVYYIRRHDRDRTLSGSNPDGSEYTCDVKYWLLIDGDFGISDADGWRSQYGGDIYLKNGSNGSINTPEVACKTIFEKTADGCPVVIY